MKCLRIENANGWYSTDGNTWEILEKITKEDLLKILDLLLDSDSPIEIDPYDETLLKNAGHQIIYKCLCDKFTAALSQREQFQDQKSALYKEAMIKYHSELVSLKKKEEE